MKFTYGCQKLCRISVSNIMQVFWFIYSAQKKHKVLLTLYDYRRCCISMESLIVLAFNTSVWVLKMCSYFLKDWIIPYLSREVSWTFQPPQRNLPVRVTDVPRFYLLKIHWTMRQHTMGHFLGILLTLRCLPTTVHLITTQQFFGSN